MPGERRAVWAGTTAPGGIATYMRVMQRTPLWEDWNVTLVVTHQEGPPFTKIAVFGCALAQFVYEVVRRRPDVVHLHAASDTSLLRKGILLAIGRLARVPVILHIHGSNFFDYYTESPPRRQRLIRAMLQRSAAVVALGDTWLQRLRSVAPAARVDAIPNAVLPQRWITGPAPGEPVHVVFLGRIGDRKGTLRLLDAWQQVSHLGCRLTIAGDGDVDGARERVRALGVEDTVTVRGWLDERAAGELLDAAHVFVLPSRNEGQPMAVLEAMSRGLCVIAGDVGGIPDMIGGGCGLLVDPDDIHGIAEALRVAVTDPVARVTYGAAAHARVGEQFDVRAVARRLDALYREVCR